MSTLGITLYAVGFVLTLICVGIATAGGKGYWIRRYGLDRDRKLFKGTATVAVGSVALMIAGMIVGFS